MEVTTKPASKDEPANPTPAVASRVHSNTRPELMAWLVILGSFSVFCLLVWLIIGLVSNFLTNTTKAEHATLSLQGDYAFVLRFDQQNHEVQGHEGNVLNEGDTVHTDKNGRATLTLFDGTRLQMAPSTQLTLESLRETGYGRTHKVIQVHVLSGVVKFLVAPHKAEDILQAYTNDDAHVQFDNTVGGVYSLELERNGESGNRTWINSNYSNSGTISVAAAGSAPQKLGVGQRLLVTKGTPPGPPDELGVELVANGSFLDGLDGWSVGHDQGGDGGSTAGRLLADGELVADQTKTRAHFMRYGGDADINFEETRLAQNLNRYVADYDHLNLEIYVKLKFQSLTGGGAMGSEYPLKIEIYYVDKNGDERQFVNGFYYINNDSSTQTYDHSGNPLLRSQEIRNNVWERYTIDLMQLAGRPTYINRVVVAASGHQFESYCAGVSLRAS